MIKSQQIIGAVHYLEQFRKQIVMMLIVLVAAASLVYVKADLVIRLLTKPLNGIQLYFMTPVDGFMAKVKVAFFGGAVLASPILLGIAVAMLAPKLSLKTKRLIYFLIIPLAALLFTAGMFFGYRMILPATISFLLESSSGFMKPNLVASDYFSFTSLLILTLGLIFELPIILIALSRIGIVTSKMLKQKRRIAIMLALVTIALIAPALDAFTYILVTLPIVVLYEASIWSIYLLERQKNLA